MRKETVFDGFISGDYECFCLCKIPFEEWVEQGRKLPRRGDKKIFLKWHEKLEALTLYPDKFFPKECRQGKWKFTITVEAEPLEKKESVEK
jgi:hypothetical protein